VPGVNGASIGSRFVAVSFLMVVLALQGSYPHFSFPSCTRNSTGRRGKQLGYHDIVNSFWISLLFHNPFFHDFSLDGFDVLCWLVVAVRRSSDCECCTA